MLGTWREAYLGRSSLEKGEEAGPSLLGAEAAVKVLNASVGLAEFVLGFAMLAGSKKVDSGPGRAAMVFVAIGLILDAAHNFKQLRSEGV